MESLRPQPVAKVRSVFEKEASQGEVAGAEHRSRPFPLDRRTGTAPSQRAVKAAEEETLIRTGMKLQGQDVFCHLPSRKLLVVVGSISDECLTALGQLSA